MILQLAFVLTAIIIGARLGGIGLGVMGGVGLAILTFVLIYFITNLHYTSVCVHVYGNIHNIELSLSECK